MTAGTRQLAWWTRDVPPSLTRAVQPSVAPDDVPPFRLRPFLAGMSLALAALTVGAAVAAVGGIFREYVTSSVVWLAFAATAWSVGWYLWSAATVPVMLLRSRVAFHVDPNTFDERAREWTRQIRTLTPTAILATAVALSAYVVAGPRVFDRLYFLPTESLWADQTNRFAEDVISCVWIAAFAIAVVPNVVGATQYLRLVHRIGRPRNSEFGAVAPPRDPSGGRRHVNGIVASLPVAREGLRHVAAFGIIGGVLWTIAAGTWGAAVAVDGARWDELVPVAVMVAFGLAILLVPQLVLRRALIRVRNARVCDLKDEGLTPAELDAAVRPLYADTTWPHGGTAVGVMAASFQLVPAAATIASEVMATT